MRTYFMEHSFKPRNLEYMIRRSTKDSAFQGSNTSPTCNPIAAPSCVRKLSNNKI